MGNHVHVAIHFLAITSLQRYAHATAAQMSCYCGNHSVSKIKFLQCLPSLTRFSLKRSSWQSGNRLVNALPGDVTIRTAGPVWLMKTSGVRRFGVQFPASFGSLIKHVIVTQSSKPKPCVCSSTEGNLWIKSSDTKNSSFHRFSSLLQR